MTIIVTGLGTLGVQPSLISLGSPRFLQRLTSRPHGLGQAPHSGTAIGDLPLTRGPPLGSLSISGTVIVISILGYFP